MDTVSRKGFLQAAGAMGAMGMAGLSGMFGTPQVVFADEADDKDASQGKDGESVDFAAREKEAAEAEGRPMDPIAYVTDKTRDELMELLRKEDEITEDYMTPSGKVIPAVYQRMRNRVNKIGYGVGTDIADSDTAWDVYMNWVSPEEAEVFCELPTFKWFTAFDAAADPLVGASRGRLRRSSGSPPSTPPRRAGETRTRSATCASRCPSAA